MSELKRYIGAIIGILVLAFITTFIVIVLPPPLIWLAKEWGKYWGLR